MTTEQRRLLALGIFAVVALILCATLIYLFSSMPPLFKRTNDYTVMFTDAPRLQAGSPVRRSGVRVGEVKDVVLDDATGKVNVKVEIDKNYTVRHNETPTLIISILGSDASIDFVPNEKDEDHSPIPPGSVITGVTSPTVSTLLNRASEVVPTTQETLNDMRKSLKRYEEMAPLIEKTIDQYRQLGQKANDEFPKVDQTIEQYRKLGETANAQLPDLTKSLKTGSDDFGAASREWRKLAENLNVLVLTNQDKLVKALDNLNLVLDRVLLVLSDANIKDVTAIIQNLRDVSSRAISIAKNLQDASDSFPSIAKNTDELIKESRATLKRLQTTLERADATMTDLQKLSQSFGDRGPLIAKNLDESLAKLNRTMTDVQELMRVIGQSDGTIKRLLTDPSLYNNLDQTACAVAKLMPRLDRILKDMEAFANKVAAHPELLGVSGVVKPSNGLKDPDPINPPLHGPH